jgi:hypothetical protein
MQRRIFIVRSIAAAAVAASAAQPALARTCSRAGGARVVRVARRAFWGAVPGGCGDHRRRRSLHAGYTLADALTGGRAR